MKPQLPSRLPDVIEGWLALFEAAAAADAPDGPLKGLQVIDGPVRKMSQVRADALTIAPGDQNMPGASSVMETQPGLGHRAYAERVEVTLAFATSSGAGKMSTRRTRAKDILAGIKAVVDAHQVNPDVWDQAWLGEAIDWFPSQNEAGAQVEVDLTLVTRSLI